MRAGTRILPAVLANVLPLTPLGAQGAAPGIAVPAARVVDPLDGCVITTDVPTTE